MSGSSIPVLLTFDLDAETMWLARDPQYSNLPVLMSHGIYGPKVAVPRILRLLDRYAMGATFFIPAWVAEKYAPVVRDIVASGHEVGHHGDMHEWPDRMERDQERRVMERGLEVLERLTGQRPVGYRSPAWEFSPQTMDLLLEYKFLYSTNFMDDDAPYLHQHKGQPTNLVELPVGWHLDDAPFCIYNPRLPGRTIQPASAILELWQEEFTALHEEGKPTLLTMHPQLVRPFRARMLEEFIRYARGFPGVTFMRCCDLAEQVRRDGGWRSGGV